MAGSEKDKPTLARRRATLAVVLLALVLVCAAWRQAGQVLDPSAMSLLAPRQAAFLAVQAPTPTPTISSEEIQIAPDQTTGIIIVTGAVVLIIIYGTLNATRRRNET